MIREFFLSLLLALALPCAADVIFDNPSNFILETKQIRLPGYPDAFNPSIIRWEGRLLMSFRNIANPKDCYNTSEIGLVWLDEEFNPVSFPQILQTSDNRIHRAEDARLIEIDGRLYMIYSDNEDPIISKDRFRVYVAELKFRDGIFHLFSKERLEHFEGNDRGLREKNWTPFDYNGTLFLSYSLNPHVVLVPQLGTEICETFAFSEQPLSWQWGELRGGTQTLWVEGYYLTFFHSSIRMISRFSDGKEMPHYFTGACAFEGTPPFAMTHISPEPIFSSDFFTGPYYKPYFGSWRGTFPGGFIADDESIYLVYGKQNHELWVAKLDKIHLLESLVPLHQ